MKNPIPEGHGTVGTYPMGEPVDRLPDFRTGARDHRARRPGLREDGSPRDAVIRVRDARVVSVERREACASREALARSGIRDG